MRNFDGTLGQIAFENYCNAGGSIQFYGRAITDWKQLGPAEQAAWYAQAIAILEHTFKASRNVKQLTGVSTRKNRVKVV